MKAGNEKKKKDVVMVATKVAMPRRTSNGVQFLLSVQSTFSTLLSSVKPVELEVRSFPNFSDVKSKASSQLCPHFR